METERIILRPWRDNDAESLFKYASDPDVGPRAGWSPHKNIEESHEIIRNYFCNDHTWAIELKATSEVIGAMGYMLPAESNIGIGESDAEVGFWVAKPYWNQGVCTEALQLIINYCIKVKNFKTLWGGFFIDNLASYRVMRKCGFCETDTIHYCNDLYGGNNRPVRIMKLQRVEKQNIS